MNSPDVEGRAVARKLRRRPPPSASPPTSVSSERASSASRIGSCGGARCEAQQPLARRLAQVRDRVVADVRVADPAARERFARAPQRDQPPVLVEERRVPALGALPRHRAARVLAPRAFEPELVAGEDHRHARATSSAGRRRRACRSREPVTVRKRAVSWLSSSGHECSVDSHGTPARNARIAATDAAPLERATPTGMPQNERPSSPGSSSARQPRPRRAAGSRRSSSRRASRARARSGRKSWPCSATSSASAPSAPRTTSATSRVEVELAVAAGHVRDVDPPAVEAGLEPAAERPPAIRAPQLVRAPVELRQTSARRAHDS